MDYSTYVISVKYKVTPKDVIQCSIMQKPDLLMSNCFVNAYIIRNSISCTSSLMLLASNYKELQQLIKLKKASSSSSVPVTLRALFFVPPRGPQAVGEVLSLQTGPEQQTTDVMWNFPSQSLCVYMCLGMKTLRAIRLQMNPVWVLIVSCLCSPNNVTATLDVRS